MTDPTLQIEDNPDWEPFLGAVKKASKTKHENDNVLELFIHGYAPKLHKAVALALSVAKWHLVPDGRRRVYGSTTTNCGCCALWWRGWGVKGSCEGCPLSTGHLASCISGTDSKIYSRILKIYTEHFDALPKSAKQRLAG